jgi:glycerol-3-phosphate dehydrogenase subunit B
VSVVVVGGGLAGCQAALAAARHRPDGEVRLLTDGETSLRAASGLVDVLGYTPDGGGPIAEPFDAIRDLPAEHPYRTVGVEAVRDALSLFDDVTGDRYAGADADRNALVATHAGNLKPTSRYPGSVAPGVASRELSTLLVGFTELTDFDAPLAGQKLTDVLPYPVAGETVDFPRTFDATPDATDFADALTADTSTDDRGESLRLVCERLARRVDHHRTGQDRIGFPAVLGRSTVETVRTTLQEQLDARVFEVPMGPPSVPGRRLESLLYDALAAAGVNVASGQRVTGAASTDGRIEAVLAETPDGRRRHEATAVVLATGGLVGGGVDSDREVVREPVFGCHVSHPADRYEWSREAALGNHPFARFGVAVDEGLRPLDDRSVPEYDNLRAAGAVLGGYDFAAEKSGSGVSLATGYVAGRLAAEASA